MPIIINVRISRFIYCGVTALVLLAACQNSSDSQDGKANAHPIVTRQNPDTLAPAPARQLIKAGQSLGQIHLNMTADSVISLLGKPDKQDAAMGTAAMTWYAHHETAGDETDVCTKAIPNDQQPAQHRVKVIRITSAWFKTPEGVQTGMLLKNFKPHYQLENIGLNAHGHHLYDDVHRGITFEIDKAQKCVAILVHVPDDKRIVSLNFY